MEHNPIADMQEQLEVNRMRWGGSPPTPAEHLLILVEEVGEIAHALQGGNGVYQWPPSYTVDAYEEIIDTAAVLLEMAYECKRAL